MPSRPNGMLLVALLAFRPRAAAQSVATASGAEDAAALLELKAAADTSHCIGLPYNADGSVNLDVGASRPCLLDSWNADTEPCGDGYDDITGGWAGIICDARGGRVMLVLLAITGVGGELLPFFGRLGALQYLWLAANPALRGDVAELAGATQLRYLDLEFSPLVGGDVAGLTPLVDLRYLNLRGCPLVAGEIGALATLNHLGEKYTDPCTDGFWAALASAGCNGALYLAGTGVHGSAAPLRALPGLNDGWGPECGWAGCALKWFDEIGFTGHAYSAADTFSPCGGSLMSGVEGVDCHGPGNLGNGWAGIDECACCPVSPLVRDAATGACVEAPVRTGSAAEDVAALRELEAAADTSACTQHFEHTTDLSPSDLRAVDGCPLDSWTADTEPCGDSWDDEASGWIGVTCDARGGRVVLVHLLGTGVGGELLPFFGRLGALLYLGLSSNPALRGDVADLAGVTELRRLWLDHCPLVTGEVLALAALIHLGERDGTLALAGTGMHGPVAALRELPGLGAVWGPEDSSNLFADETFSPCSAFEHRCTTARLLLVTDAASVAGIDECACCLSSTKVRQLGTDACVTGK